MWHIHIRIPLKILFKHTVKPELTTTCLFGDFWVSRMVVVLKLECSFTNFLLNCKQYLVKLPNPRSSTICNKRTHREKKLLPFSLLNHRSCFDDSAEKKQQFFTDISRSDLKSFLTDIINGIIKGAIYL